MRFTKPFLTPKEQVALLAKRGMVINDPAKAEECLARIGYYRLSAYWYPFREAFLATDIKDKTQKPVRNNSLQAGKKFSTILDLYVFDKRLRLIVLDALERIEVALRTQIAIIMGGIGPSAHRDSANLHDRFTRQARWNGPHQTKYEYWLGELDRKFRDSKEEFAKHFRVHYPQDNPPIWVAVEVWDFGTLSHFYAGMKQSHKDQIAKLYGLPPGGIFETWIRSLNDVRNLCAHHSRLWNRALVNNPKLPKLGAIPTFDCLHDSVHYQTRLYAALLILDHLLSVINPTTKWRQRLLDHITTLPPNLHFTLRSAGFPPNWKDLRPWL